jgi:hypothetical protein
MKNLRPSGKADEELHEPEGLEVHISHEHLAKLGYKVPPSVGTKVSLHGAGEVTESHSGEVHGETRHHIRLTLHRAEMETQDRPGDARKGIRGDIEDAAEKISAKAKADVKVPERG